jgi:acetyl-CoA carboxylase carboxyltransferase component
MDAAQRERQSLRAEAEAGRPAAVDRQHEQGKLTARERLDLLLDAGSFTELGIFRGASGPGGGPTGDGVVTGSGLIEGRRVFVFAQDFTVAGGSLGPSHAAKIQQVIDLALDTGSPLVGLNDSGGARIQDGALALDGYGGIFRRQVAASGVIPQISVVLGPCAGGAAYSPALTDFTFMLRSGSQLYLTGPDVVRAVTGEEVTHAQLGGAQMHGARSGVAAFVRDDEASCLTDVRFLVSILPANNLEQPPRWASASVDGDLRPDLARIVPADPRRSYDVRRVIEELVDDRDYLEVHEEWAGNIVVAFGRIEGRVVGLVANQPVDQAGVLDVAAAQKAARFVRFCDTFNVPLVTLVDVPGFLPGLDQEAAGIIRSGAALLYAYCDATVPRIQVILRKAYGGAYIVMDSRSIGADLCLAWPTNEVAVMGAEAAVDVVHRRELAASDHPAALRVELAAEYAEDLMNPGFAAEHGLVDDVIDPAQTRIALARGLAMLADKRVPTTPRKHGNSPL